MSDDKLYKGKRCRRCEQHKSMEYFYKYPLNKDGRENICKECKKEEQRVYRKRARRKPSDLEVPFKIDHDYGL